MASDLFSIEQKMNRLRAELEALPPDVGRGLNTALDISWIHHDSALEGDIFDADEILAAIEGRPPASGSTQQVSLRIRTIKAAIDAARREPVQQGAEDLLSLLKRLHAVLVPGPTARGGRYRRGGVSNRTYLHDVARPSRISYLLRKLFAWVDSEEARRLHPLQVAGEIHYRLLLTCPFDEQSGPASRLFINHFLWSRGYLPAIIHAKDRQRYYESFACPDAEDLTALIADSMGNSIDSSMRLVEQRSRAARTRFAG